MPDTQNNQCLSFGDALFLYLEREGAPLSVASVCVFEGIVPLETSIDFIESKLHLVPRYCQKVVMPPFNLGLPTWQFDPDFNIRNHVREITLKRGTEEELKTVAGEILSVMLDRSRPLWDIILVRGLKGNRTGMIFRVHHALADGISGVGIMNILMDPSPVPPVLPKIKHHFEAPPPRDSATALLDGLLQSAFSAVERVLTVQSQLLTLAQRLVSPEAEAPEAAAEQNGDGNGNGLNSQPPAPSLGELTRALPDLAGAVQKLPFNVLCRGPQRFRWTELSLAEIKAVKNACGCTVNDVVLAVVTGAMRRYAERHQLPLEGRMLRIVVPVNVRGKGKASELGNRITFLPVALPMDIHDPKAMMEAVRERMALLKSAGLAQLVGLAGTLLGTIPTPIMQAVIAPALSNLPLSLCNTICTNVPGPKVPLYLVGHKLIATYPRVPIGGEMGMNVAILTYNGVAHFGFTCDANSVPDAEVMEEYVPESFAELRQAFGVAPVRPAAKKRAARKPAAKPRRAKATTKAAPAAEVPAVTPEPPEAAAEAEPAQVKVTGAGA